MAKPNLQQLLNTAKQSPAKPAKSPASTSKTLAVLPATEGAPRRQIHRPGEKNISAYFPSEVKAALRLIQAKTGKSVKGCLGEALEELFRKYNVPVPAELTAIDD